MTGIILIGMNASKDTRWHQRFENLERAFRLLQEAAGRQSLSDLEAEGMVQRFEYTFELAWKTLKDFLELQGFTVAYPREVIKTAFQVGLISMGDAWFEMLDRRNEAAHTYDRQRFLEITNAIRTTFLPALTALVDRLSQEQGQFGLSAAHLEAIARIEAIQPEQPSPWPDLEARVQALYPDGVVSPSASDVLYEDRG